MRQLTVIFAILAGLAICASRLVASDLVEGSDVRAEPMKKALDALVKAIGSGDVEKAEALYAGDKTDVELLKAYVNGVTAAKAMRAAMLAKFGDHPDDSPAGLDVDVARMAVKDFNSVIFNDDADRASSSADSPLGVGIEFKRVDGTWKVLSLVSAPQKVEDHLERLQTYILTVKTITEKIKSGAYQKYDDATGAADDAKAQLWPSTVTVPAATRPS